MRLRPFTSISPHGISSFPVRVHLHGAVSILTRWFRCCLHNLISAIALASQIEYITHCCRKGFAGYHRYSGSQVSSASRWSKAIVDLLWVNRRWKELMQKTNKLKRQPHAEWVTMHNTPYSWNLQKHCDFQAPDKVTLSRLVDSLSS